MPSDKSPAIIYFSPMEGLEVLSCNNSRPFGNHLHDGYVLWLNSESGENYRLKGSSDILQPGSISIIEPETIHSNTPFPSARRHLRSFYLSTGFVNMLENKIEPGRNRAPCFRNRTVEDRRLWLELASLHDRLLTQTDRLSVETGLILIFARLYDKSLEHSRRQEVGEDRRIAMLVDYLHANLDRNVFLAELAELAGCTEFHLIRIFSRYRGLPPHSFLVQLRLEKARSSLAEGKSIAETALLCGFSDQSHLTRLFKVRYGLTPRQYQKHRCATS
ncbi:helix-turn-helix domain-containing protein [Maridesulfovibrio sp. FT414]|uniref:helix-turn-helix domain-containing protein n=1 Tax=Maridesulfovibrio sp. FT414 TaxID=2979469 RepID=UPI003D802E1F